MVYLLAGNSDLFLILDCMTSNFYNNQLLLELFHFCYCPLWRTDTIVFAKLNKPPLLKPPPPAPAGA